MSLVSFANYEWFEEWKDDKVSNRSPEYKELKQAFIDSILEVVFDVFPKITRDKVTRVPSLLISFLYCVFRRYIAQYIFSGSAGLALLLCSVKRNSTTSLT